MATVKKLLIKVNNEPAGYLAAEMNVDGGIQYSFTYMPDSGPEVALSKTMPVRSRSYTFPTMIPALDMGLPEGHLRVHLEQRFAKELTMDPMGLLFVTGRTRVGNITAELPADNTDPVLAQLDEALQERARQQEGISAGDVTGVTDEQMESWLSDLMTSYAPTSGVGGYQPKVMAKVGQDADKDARKRMTATTANYIIKTSDNDLPYLALNEHLCLKAAMRAGLDVPKRVLSENGEVLLIKRFDIMRGVPGGRYALEDGCVMQGKPSTDKYSGSMEKLANSLLSPLSGRTRRAASKTLFTMAVVNALVRNGDAHLKNFAIMVDRQGNAKLAKAYDINTTKAYTAFRHSKPALMMGNTQRWPTEKELIRFGQNTCHLDERDCREIIKKGVRAVTTIGQTIPQEIKAYPGSAHVLSAMVEQWNDSIKSLTAKKDKEKSAVATGLDEVEQDLRQQYGDPYSGQKDRDQRIQSVSEKMERKIMYSGFSR